MAGPKGYSLWDVVTLSRVGGTNTEGLTRALRIRAARSWNRGLPDAESTGHSKSGWARIRAIVPAWSRWVVVIVILAGTSAMVFVVPQESRLGMIANQVLAGLLCLAWLAALPWILMRRDPRLSVLRRQRSKFARRAMNSAVTEQAGLAGEVGIRRNGWASGVTRPTGFIQRLRLLWSYPPAHALVLLVLIGSEARAVVRPLAGASGLWSSLEWISTLAAFLGMAAAFWLPGALLRRLDRSMRDGSCPDCGYDLRAIPAAIELGGAATIGPARCPECGAPWPLIPPGVEHPEEKPVV